LRRIGKLERCGCLGKPDALGSSPLLQWASPLAGFVFLAVCLRLFAFGVRHYSSTGS
jgi:ABC-2 type transport system permease protein